MAVDIVIQETIDLVDITVNPNIIEVNVTRTSGGGAGIPTLQQVLTAGNTTTETVIFGDITADYLSIENNSIGIANSETGEYSNFNIGGLQIFDNDNNYAEINFNYGFSTGNSLTGGSYLKGDQLLIATSDKTSTLTREYLALQDAMDTITPLTTVFLVDKLQVNDNEYLYPTGTSSPLATLDDITGGVTQTSQLTNDGADGVNPFITALDIPTTGQASTLVREVKNMTGATLTKGTVVYISGANGNKALVSKALATTDPLSARTFGLLQSNILNNGLGNCVIIGDLSGVNTSSFAEGAQLYLSGVTAGTFTDTRVLAPTHLVYVGKVTRSHPTQGQIEVQIQNGYELAEIHDVQIITPLNNQALIYETSSELWKNKTIIEDSITNGVTDKAPSQNAVFDLFQFTRRLITNGSGSVTGTTAETILTSLTISANTLDSKCFIWSTMDYFKTSGGACTLRLYINTSNSLSGATLIGFASVGSNRNVSFNRKLYLNGTTLDFLSSNTGATQISNEFIEAIFGASTTLTVNPANDIFLIYTTQNDAVGTTATAKQATVQKLKLN
jgi:hypothetical protein